MITRVGLIRHGQTQWNVDGRWQGHAHVPLNDEGRQQAHRLAEHLMEQHFQIAAVYSSDQLRAMETAQIVASTLNAPLFPDVRLREIDMGDWQGLTGEEIRAWDKERYEVISNDPYNVPRPNGESLNQVAERATRAMTEYVTKHPDAHILVFSHGGTIRTVLHRLGLIHDDWHGLGNTSVTTLTHADGTWQIQELNAQEHLNKGTPLPMDNPET